MREDQKQAIGVGKGRLACAQVTRIHGCDCVEGQKVHLGVIGAMVFKLSIQIDCDLHDGRRDLGMG